MPWELSDPYGIEDELEHMGTHVWEVWLRVKPELLTDPTPTNQRLHITETDTTQLWLDEGTDVYLLIFPTDDNHVMLIKAVNLLEELR